MNVYSQIINNHLQTRNFKNMTTTDKQYNLPIYVVRMCKDLLSIIQENRTDITLEDVLRIETSCAGHTDYAHKLALRCKELEARQ